MRKTVHFFLWIFILTTALYPAFASSRTFYISYSLGSNTNPGTQASPWKTEPYMNHSAGCDSSVGPTYTHQNGDQFLFYGGDTWPSACLPVHITTGGIASAIDYHGVCEFGDPYSPCDTTASWPSSGWTQPIWDAAHATKNHMFDASGISYWTLDNINIENQGITPSSSFSSASCGIYTQNLNGMGSWLPGTTVANVFLHDWAITSSLISGGANYYGVCGGGILGVALVDGVEISDANGYAFINGSQVNQPFGGGVAGVGELRFSKIHDGSNGCTTSGSCHDSEFYNSNGNSITGFTGFHPQVIEDNEPCPSVPGSEMDVYNNIIRDGGSGSVAIYVRYWSKVYNNVIYNFTNNYPIRLCIPNSDNALNVGQVMNNTIDTTGNNEGGTPVGMQANSSGSTKGAGQLFVQNNIIVNGNTNVAGGATPLTNTNNYAMPTSEATTFGFTAANKYGPTSSDATVVGVGRNASSLCVGGLTALCLDVEGAHWYGGTYKSRQASGGGNWNLGAYTCTTCSPGGGGGGTPPTVTITSPSAGTITGSTTLTATCVPSSGSITSIQFTFDGSPYDVSGTGSPYSKILPTTEISNGNHTIGASCTDSNNLTGSASPIAVTVSNSLGAGCFVTNFDISGQPWSGNTSITTQNGTFSQQVSITPYASGENNVITYASAVPTSYGGNAALVQFFSNGHIWVYNGSLSPPNYVDSGVSYTAGTTYVLNFTHNITSDLYSVAEVSPSSNVLATNFGYRASGVTSLSVVAGEATAIVPNTALVCVGSLGSPTIGFSPSPMSFGFVGIGGNASFPLNITITGGTASISAINISGTNSTDFSITNNGTCLSGPLSSCQIIVQFTPSLIGFEQAQINFTDTAGGSPQSVAVSGTGAITTPVPPTTKVIQ